MTPTLRLLTFENLVTLAERSKKRARTTDKIEGWDRLLTVARGLAGSGSGADDVAVGRTWSLVKIRIQGYQGVGAAEPLEIDLDPAPGVTVIHGPNGSGKSSIADAIETALHGTPRQPLATGSGGNEPLWEREHCGRDADEASVEVTVLSDGERLVLSCQLDSSGQVTERRVQRIAGSAATDVDLSTTTWHSALVGHRPVFGYAAVERQVQLARNLQEFLEPLLAFGGCFEKLKTDVTQAGAASAVAKRRWDHAVASAQSAIAKVDQARARPSAPDLPELVWPGIGEDPDQWLAAFELAEEGQSVPEVTEEHHNRLSSAAVQAVAALSDLEGAEISLHARLAGPLVDLHKRAKTLPKPGDTCPVCASSDVPWMSTLHDSVTGLVTLDAQETAFRLELRNLRQAIDTDLADVVAVLRQDWYDEQITTASNPTIERSTALCNTLEQHGQRATPEVRMAVRSVYECVSSEDWRAIVLEAARQSNHRRQWLRARRAVLEDFIHSWRNVAPDGRAADSWESAETCLRDLQNQLRNQRAEDLHTLTDTTVQQLLHDVGLSVTAFSVKGTKASVEVTDCAGKPVRLSMLSAGQRNALLLAPLLAVSHGGSFGFLVLDDPVHAFDQVRVDRLAYIIHDLATNRRVIVLTHDERLTEHLLARSADCDVRSVSREPSTGKVTSEITHSIWQVLVNDARAALHLAHSQRDGITVVPDDLVRSLCRIALDNALRQFVTQEAMRGNRDPGPDLDALDAANTTKKRIAVVKKIHPASSAVNDAEQHIAPHLDAWSQAIHGNAPISPVQVGEVDAAEWACRVLLGAP